MYNIFGIIYQFPKLHFNPSKTNRCYLGLLATFVFKLKPKKPKTL